MFSSQTQRYQRRPQIRAACLAIFVAVATAVLCGPAVAAEIEWGGGVTDLVIAGARRCTLNVSFGPSEVANLREWRLVWTAAGREVPVRIVPSTGNAVAAGVCDVRADGIEDRGGRVDTAYFCSGGRVPTAAIQCVIDIPSASPAKIAIVPFLSNNGGLPTASGAVAEATINGGTTLRYPPVVVAMTPANVGKTTTYHVSGEYLANVTSAHIVQSSSHRAIPVQVIGRDNETVDLRGPMLERLGSGILVVRNADGQLGAMPVDWRGSGLMKSLAPRLLLEVDPRAVLAGTLGGEDTLTQDVLTPEFLSALMNEGAASVAPLFSARSREVARSTTTNLLGEPIAPVPLDRWFIVTLGVDADVQSVVERVRNTAGVRAVCEDKWMYMACLNPNDPLFPQQWGLANQGGTLCGYTSLGGRDIGATASWDSTTGSPGVRIGVLDTGIANDHEDFGLGRVVLGPDFVDSGGVAYDDNGHGSSVGGIAAATGNNGTGIAGVAWVGQLWAGKVLDVGGGGTPSELAAGLGWANENSLPIVNMSLGWNDANISTTDHNMLADATLALFKRGLLLVAASGNVDTGNQFYACPADLDRRVYAVGAVLPNGVRWQDVAELQATDCSFYFPCEDSNFGPFLDVMAPGGRLIATTDLAPSGYLTLNSCVFGDRTTMGFSGTSASAPVVSGIAALLLARRPELTGEDIEQVLNRTAAGPYFGWTEEYGWGRVSALWAIQFVGGAGRVVAHWGAGAGPFSIGALQVVDSTLIASREFKGVPGMPSGDYTTSCVRYHLRASLTWPFRFAPGVSGWTRSSGTIAWKDIGPYDYRVQVDTASFVPATFGTTGATVDAYVFRVRDASDPSRTVGWFPTDPANARVALTVIGDPAPGETAVGPGTIAARLRIMSIPNPSHGASKIVLEIPKSGHVRGIIVDLAGRRIATVVDRELEAGRYEYSWNGTTDAGGHCPAGAYFCRVDCGGVCTTARFIRLSSK